jgi:hypothetical protein
MYASNFHLHIASEYIPVAGAAGLAGEFENNAKYDDTEADCFSISSTHF